MMVLCTHGECNGLFFLLTITRSWVGQCVILVMVWSPTTSPAKLLREDKGRLYARLKAPTDRFALPAAIYAHFSQSQAATRGALGLKTLSLSIRTSSLLIAA